MTSESKEFLKTLVSNKKASQVSQQDSPQNDIPHINGAEQREHSKKQSIFDELVAESKMDFDSRKVPLMSHVNPEIYEKIMLLCKKTGRTKSRVINDILTKVFME